ncbi:hypothetical protein F5Y04DRAFT_226236 [Hypomontagnella monticulosa]|nr:hypothetical protein F5Y04DRAFT_226236 [Hypomontagnella monticulosa]
MARTHFATLSAWAQVPTQMESENDNSHPFFFPSDVPPIQTDLALKATVDETVQFDRTPFGCINLANIASLYITELEDSYVLEDYNSSRSALMDRYCALVIGLRGRFGLRSDRGRAKPDDQKVSSHLISSPSLEELKFWCEYLEPKEDTLFGITGILYGQRNAQQSEISLVHFALHPDSLLPNNFRDQTPLLDLFWLSMGHIQLHDGTNRVADLSFDLPPEWIRGEPSTQFWKLQSTSRYYVETEITALAKLLQVNLDCMYRFEDVSGVEVNFSNEHPLGSRLPRAMESQWSLIDGTSTSQYIWRSDLHKIASAILSIPLGPLSFLARRLPLSLFKRSEHKELIVNLLKHTTSEGHTGVDPGTHQTESDLLEYFKIETRHFSRQRAELCSQLQSELNPKRVTTPWRAIVEILTLTSKDFRRAVQESVSGAQHNSFWTMKAETWFPPNVVEITPPGGTSTQHKIEFTKLFPNMEIQEFRKTPTHCCDPIPSVLFASLQVVMFYNYENSDELINFVSSMADRVSVSPDQKPGPVSSSLGGYEWDSDIDSALSMTP